MLVKRTAACTHHFQPFPSNSTRKFRSSPFLHILASRGYVPGTIVVNVTWMEREFNAGQTHSNTYPSSGVFRISQRVGTHPSLPSSPPFPSLLLSLPYPPSIPSPHFPGPLPPNTARGSGGALKLPQRIWAESGRQTVSSAF